MNKKILIAIALVFILSLLGVWGYFLVYGTPESVEDVFASFGSSSEQVDMMTPEPSQTGDSDVDQTPDSDQTTEVPSTPSQPVRQITTDPVSGFTILGNDFGTSTVLYAHLGTGHVYTHNFVDNERTRVSNQTFRGVRDTYFTRDGLFAVLVVGYGTNQQLQILDLSSTSTTPTILDRAAKNLAVLGNNQIVYTVTTQNQTTAYSLNPATGAEQTLFTVPIRQVHVAWGSTPASDHLVYPAPARNLTSRLLRITNGQIRQTNVSGYELSALNSNGRIAYSYLETSGGYETNITALNNSTFTNEQRFATQALNEKCTFITDGELLCAYSQSSRAIDLIGWYKGTLQLSDRLWMINPERGSASMVLDIARQSGRQVDVDRITTNDDITIIRNRTDGTLWGVDMASIR